MKLYMAGGLFSTGERQFNSKLASFLAALGHEIHLPQDKEPREKGAKAIFDADVAGIDWCETLVGNMDGPDPDSGTCWEIGYAYRRKPIILFRTDIRDVSDGFAPINLMMYCSADAFIHRPLCSPLGLAGFIHNELDILRRQK